jgi:hypothetical protein
VLNAVAKETGNSRQVIEHRLKAVEPDVGVIDLEADSPRAKGMQGLDTPPGSWSDARDGRDVTPDRLSDHPMCWSTRNG